MEVKEEKARSGRPRPQARFYRSLLLSRQGLQGTAHGRTDGQCTCYHAQPASVKGDS